MIEIKIKVLGRAAIVLGALKHKKRCMIVNKMAEKKYMTSAEIYRDCQPISKTNISNQLKILQDAGIICTIGHIPSRGYPIAIYAVRMEQLDKAYRCINFLAVLPPNSTPVKRKRTV